jgi:dihydrofolate reductase
MSKLRCSVTTSLDGYVAGANQSADNPLGEGGIRLHDWAFPTKTFRALHGDVSGGETGINDDALLEVFENVGATIMGRNKLGPVLGPWGRDPWKGWWGENPPFHHPVFVLTHHPRASITMQGGTTFHFVDDGIDAALDRAFSAAGGDDVRLGGGPGTVQQYLRAGLIDELHVVIVPILLGSGERLFDHLGGGPDNYECVEFVCSPSVAHARFSRGPR